MTTEVEPVAPVVLAHGRFKLSQAPDESLHVGIATNICDRCRECGCGEPRPQYHVPGMMLRMFGSKLRGFFGGDDGDDDGPRAA